MGTSSIHNGGYDHLGRDTTDHAANHDHDAEGTNERPVRNSTLRWVSEPKGLCS